LLRERELTVDLSWVLTMRTKVWLARQIAVARAGDCGRVVARPFLTDFSLSYFQSPNIGNFG